MLIIKPTTAKKLIKEIIETKTLPDDIDIILSGISLYKPLINQSALHNANGGLIIYGINPKYELKRIHDSESFINKIKEKMQGLNHDLATIFTTTNYKTYPIIIHEIPKAPIELQPIRKDYNIDSVSYYIKNKQIEIIPTYILNSILAINHTPQRESTEPTYKTKYDDVDLKHKFIENYRKEYTNKYNLPDSDLLRSLLPSYIISIYYILSFSYLPQHYFPYLYINISDRRKDIKDYKITGSLFHMLKMSMLQIKKLLKATLSVDKKGNLISKTTYIFEILYELLYNALIHRDYSPKYQGEPINIYIYKDKITITNPGYYHSDNSNYLYSNFKYARNSSVKIILDTLIKSKKHSFKYMRRLSHIYKCKEPRLYNQEGLFVATIFSMQEESIYKEPYTIEAIGSYCMEPRTKIELYNHFFDMNKKDYGYFFSKYIEPLIDNGLLEYLYPDKPKTKFQKIKTSEKGIEMLFEH